MGSEVPEWPPSGLTLCSALARGGGDAAATAGSSRSIFNFLSLSRAQGSGPLVLGIGFQASPSGLMAQVIQPG